MPADRKAPCASSAAGAGGRGGEQGLEVAEYPLAGLVVHDGIALGMLAEAAPRIFEIDDMRNQGHRKGGKTNPNHERRPSQQKGDAPLDGANATEGRWIGRSGQGLSRPFRRN